MIEIGTLDGLHSLLQFQRLTTVFDGQEICARLILPSPSGSRLLALDHLPDVSNLLIDPPN
jgi:hypothetical protein